MLPERIIACILYFFFVLQVIQFAQWHLLLFTLPVKVSSPSTTNGSGVLRQIFRRRRRRHHPNIGHYLDLASLGSKFISTVVLPLKNYFLPDENVVQQFSFRFDT